jgi:hypothetical protein
MTCLREVLFWLASIIDMAGFLSLREPQPLLCSGPVDELFRPAFSRSIRSSTDRYI